MRSRIAQGRPARVGLGWVDWALVAAAASLTVAALWPAGEGTIDPLAQAYGDRIDVVAEELGDGAQARDMAVVVLAAPPPRAEDDPPATGGEPRP